MLHRSPLLAGPLAVLIAGCSVPEPAAPDAGVEMPQRYGVDTPDGTIATDWWKTFGDPVLDQLVAQALEHNQDLRVAVARLDAAAVEATIAGASLLPTLDAGFTAARQRQVFVGLPFPGGGTLSRTYNSFGVDLTAAWELDLWGRVRAGESAAYAELAASVADVHGAQVSLAAQVARAWFALVESRLQQELAERSVASFAATTDAVQRRFATGVRPALDVHLATNSLRAGEAVLALRDEQRQRAVRQLELLLGRYPDGRTVAGAVLPPVGGPPPAGLPAELLRRRPDLVAAEQRAFAQDHRVAAATAALYPRFVLTASAGTSTAEVEDVFDPDFFVWSLIGNITAPLFRGGALTAEVELQQAQLRAVLADYAATVQRAFAEVEIALAVEAALAERERQLAAAADAANAAATAAESRYLSGLENIITVLEAQRRARDAESQQLVAQRARLDARITLFAALGGGFSSEAPDEPPAETPSR